MFVQGNINHIWNSHPPTTHPYRECSNSCVSYYKIYPRLLHWGAFTHTRGEENFASPIIRESRQGTFVSPRFCVYGPASTSGTTTIQSYKNGGFPFRDEYSLELTVQWMILASEYPSRVKKQDRVSCRLASLMYVWFHYERIAQSDKRCRARHHLASLDKFWLSHSLALASCERHQLASRMCECPFKCHRFCLASISVIHKNYLSVQTDITKS